MFDTTKLTETSKSLAEKLHAALNHQDRDLTPEGLAKRRLDMASMVRNSFGRKVQEHRTELYYDHRNRAAFDKHRIKLDWNNPAQVAKAQSKWAAVREKLDAGLTIGQIIEHADETTLAAVREFWGDHAEAKQAGSLVSGQTFEPVDTTAVLRAVDERTAVVKGAEGSLRTAREATAAEASARITIDHLEAVCEGRTNDVTDLGVALAAAAARSDALAPGSAIIASQGQLQDSQEDVSQEQVAG